MTSQDKKGKEKKKFDKKKKGEAHISKEWDSNCFSSNSDDEGLVASAFNKSSLGLGIRSIRVIWFYLFVFLKFRVMKNENRNFQNNFRNRTRIDPQFRFSLFDPPNRLE
jgi:hypothetical protein